MLFLVVVCAQFQLPAVARDQVSVFELGGMEQGDCALLPFDDSQGAFFVTPNTYSVAIDRNRWGYKRTWKSTWYGHNDTSQSGLFTLGNEPARVFVCAETTTELRIVGCYLGDNGFDVISPGTGNIDKTELPRQRIGYILVDTNATMSFSISTTNGAVKVRVTDRNDHTTEYSGNVPKTEYPDGSAAFVDVEVVDNFEGSLSISFDGGTNDPVFRDVKPSDAGDAIKIHSQATSTDISRQKPVYSDAQRPIPVSGVFISVFVLVAILIVVYLIFFPRLRIP